MTSISGHPAVRPTPIPTDALDQSANAPGHASSRVDITEKPALAAGSGPAFLALLLILALTAASTALLVLGFIAAATGRPGAVLRIVAGSVGLLIALPLFDSFTIVVPGETSVRQFLGRYIGTVRHTGLVLVPPLTTGRRVSIKVHNFETNELKVNDLDGNPVNIAAIVVWQVADTARAVFAVEAYEEFIKAQAESALRHVATTHPYDEPGPGETSLRGGTDVVSAELAAEVAARVALAGLEIVEVRISSLAYAPEIAQAMLQRQQAGAVIAAREQIEVLLRRALDDAGRGVKAAPMRGRGRPRKDSGEGGSKNGTAEPSDVVDPPADSE